MRILRSIVAPSTAFVAFCDSKMTGCSSIRSEIIGDELVWDKAIFLQQFAHQFERGPFVPPALDQHTEGLAFGARLLEDFGREPVPLLADYLQPLGYVIVSEAASPNCRDNTAWPALL